jgi:hypothetical protein
VADGESGYRVEMTQNRCPVCGQGVLKDIAYDEGGTAPADERPEQRADSLQIETYACGHVVRGPRLDRADEALDVERRASDEAILPPDETTGA